MKPTRARRHNSRVTAEQLARWRQRSPDECLAAAHYSRAKKMNGGIPNGFWTARQWRRLCASVGWKCTYCRRQTRRLSPDHMLPLARGGSNALWNIAPVCRECQLRKGVRPLWDYFSPDIYAILMAWLHPYDEGYQM